MYVPLYHPRINPLVMLSHDFVLIARQKWHCVHTCKRNSTLHNFTYSLLFSMLCNSGESSFDMIRTRTQLNQLLVSKATSVRCLISTWPFSSMKCVWCQEAGITQVISARICYTTCNHIDIPPCASISDVVATTWLEQSQNTLHVGHSS